jgi:NAD+ synthase (glutamine-hydrolysing)
VEGLPEIALAQMEVRPGRPDLNVERMLELIEAARQSVAEVVVFPELCVSGYIIGDQWEVDALVEDFVAWGEEICRASHGLTVVFGNVALDPRRRGEDGRRRKYNAVYVCHDGAYLQRPDLPQGLPCGIQPKTLHPNYRFFDDDRHFHSLRKLAQEAQRPLRDWLVPFEISRRDGGLFRFGVQLCEDMWCQDYRGQDGPVDTLKVYHELGVDAVFNLSASPWTWQKNDKRNRVVRHILADSPVPFFYVNQVGAQNNGKNILVFDGDTTAYGAGGVAVARAHPWREQLLLTDSKTGAFPDQDETEAVYDAVLAGIRHLDHLRGADNRFLVGVSGGIDSSVVAALLVQALGPQRVRAVNTPTQFNSQITRDNARKTCQSLGIDYLSLPIQDLYDKVASTIKEAAFADGAGDYTRLVDENIQARIRGADILSGLAAKYGLVFTNNGNKTEVALGYATLYGDVSGAIAPIADLYKHQVVQLGRFLNERIFEKQIIPENLLSFATVPSAELSAAQDVTQGLGDPIKYGYHCAVLRQLIEYRRHPVDLLRWRLDGQLLDQLQWDDSKAFDAYFPDAATWVEDLEWVENQLRINYFKRVQAPPIVVLSKRAFGFDLRETQGPAYRPRAYAQLKAQVLGS